MIGRILFVAAFLLGFTSMAEAQSTVRLCYGNPCVAVDATHGLPTTGGSGGGGAVWGPDALGVAPTHPPIMLGGTSDGTGTGTVSVWKVASGIGFINCSNCSGSGISVAFGGAIGSVGTPGGLKDPATGFFQPIPGDVTNGQYVNIKASVTVPVSLAANQSVNVAQLAGAATATGAGATNPGTIRTVTASDDPLLTTASTILPATNSKTNSYSNGTVSPLNANLNGGIYAIQEDNVTLTDCSGTVATGGTAVNAFTAQTKLRGFTIVNTNTSEVMWISFTTTAAASTAGSYPIPAPTATTFAGGGSFTTPPGMGTNHALSVVAATNGHSFSCTWW